MTVVMRSFTPPAARNGSSRTEREKEERRKLQDELDNAKYYPVVNFGLTIGF